MTDRAALYRAVVAEPADDLPRLVIADWFEENGDPDRAAYVRASVELAELVASGRLDADAYAAAVTVVAGVPEAVLWEWVRGDGLPAAGAPALLGRGTVGDLDRVRDVAANVTYGFRRGFVSEVKCPAGFWTRFGPAVVAAAPVERVNLVELRPFRNGPSEWVWRRAESALGDGANVVPAGVFAKLPGGQSHVASYRTRAAAEAALSAACLAFARGDEYAGGAL